MLRTPSIPHSPANIPHSSGLDLVRRQDSAPPEAKTDLIKSFLAGYAETISTDEEVEDVPYAEDPVDSPPMPSANPLRSAGLKRTAVARADEWDSSDTEDDIYTPTSNIKTKGKDTEKSKRDTRNVRRREKYASDTQETSQRPSKITKPPVSPQLEKKKRSIPPHENIAVKPEFERGKRVVKRDGYSQTREFRKTPLPLNLY
jgi:hypothetical protein